SIAAHIGEKDRLGAVREDERRTSLVIARRAEADRRAEAAFGQRRIPGERRGARDQQVGGAIAIQIDVTQGRIAPVDARLRRKKLERLEAAVLGAGKVSRLLCLIKDELLAPIPVEIDDLLAARPEPRERRLRGEQTTRCELAAAEVALIKERW